MTMSQHKVEHSLFLYEKVIFSPASETKFLVLCKIHIYCFIQAIDEKYQGIQFGNYIRVVYIAYAKTKSNKIKFYLRVFLYLKIIDFKEISFTLS